jgi:tellurite methyltransferase
MVSIVLALGANLVSRAARADELRPSGSNAFQEVTGDDLEGDRQHWDNIFNTPAYVFGKEPAPFLSSHLKLLPPPGRALDIAMGEGRNAVFLAKHGFNVTGVDISEVAIAKAKRLARENRVVVRVVNADLSTYTIRPGTYDLIVNIDFLLRDLIPQIKRGLKKGGVVVFENYTMDQLKNAGGATLQKEFLLKKGELAELFKDFKILVYEETNDGKNAFASLIAQKP